MYPKIKLTSETWCPFHIILMCFLMPIQWQSFLCRLIPHLDASIDERASALKALTILKETVTLCPAHVLSLSGGYMDTLEHFQECVSIKYGFVLWLFLVVFVWMHDYHVVEQRCFDCIYHYSMRHSLKCVWHTTAFFVCGRLTHGSDGTLL